MPWRMHAAASVTNMLKTQVNALRDHEFHIDNTHV